MSAPELTYRLFMSPRSPFVRRIRFALLRLKLPFDEVVVDAFNPTDEFLQASPLGLLPVLELPDGVFIPDAATILDYLDETHPPGIWPENPIVRVKVRVASTWAEGLMTAVVNHHLESRRTAPDADWSQDFEDTLIRTLGRIQEQDLSKEPWMFEGRPTQAFWDLGVSLEYIDLRFPRLEWRKLFPRLIPVLDECRKSPLFRETAPPPA